MPQKRKLQVFVSSTYTDLKEERQAAVEAILTAGHIPAGMELFAAGDESQMAVIRRWIDESDVYLLLLGGRYGSIEPVSSKSYTHLEYEYAIEKGKAIFAVVIDESFLKQKVKKRGVDIWENENPYKLKEFRNLVTSRLVKFWSDLRDIKLAILQTLSDFERRNDLVGWIPGSESSDSKIIAEELARLTKENAELKLQQRQAIKNSTLYNDLTFDEMYKLLSIEEINLQNYDLHYIALFENTVKLFGDEFPAVIHLFSLWTLYEETQEFETEENSHLEYWMLKLVEFGIVTPMYIEQFGSRAGRSAAGFYQINDIGKKFFLRLKLERNVKEVSKLVKQLKELSGEDRFYPLER